MSVANPATTTVFSTQWHIGRLVICHLLALLLLFSYMLPPTYAMWRELDQWIFLTFNGSLSQGGDWLRFWAWSNVRMLDLVPALLMLSSFTFTFFGLKRQQLQPALFGFVLLLLFVMLPFRILMHKLALSQGFSPLSPSQVLSPSYLFSELAGDIPAKDKALNSFPGDHATVLLCWAGMLTINIRHRIFSFVPILLALVFMLPRLVGGAHWASDNLVGGLVTAILALSWAFCTPVLQQVTLLTCRLLSPLTRLIGKLPIIGSLSFFNPN